MRILPLLAFLFFLPQSVFSADSYMNIPAQESGNAIIYRPGMSFILPDGRTGIVKEQMPDGRLITDLGIILTPEGLIADGPDAGATVLPNLAGPKQNGQKPEATPAPNTPLADINRQNPDLPAIKPEAAKQPGSQENTKIIKPEISLPEPQAARANNQDHYLSIVELLPMTGIPANEKPQQEPAAKQGDQKKAEGKKPSETKREHPAHVKKAAEDKGAAQVKEPEAKKHAPKIPEAQIQPPKTPEPKTQPKKPQKIAPGKELRIPEDAKKTGDLSFLEGCWQGTRPEYYSKRTIKECFCFGENGSYGKRRVIDPLGKRKCIGSTKASLSSNGILSVTSSGAVCDDGERWGQAEMVCKNSGPRTPCTWVFRDAQNGRQSYEIPFVRVESCGR